jgi:hypothetical protein
MSDAPLELNDVLHIQTKDGATLSFEVIGIVEDSEAETSYAVLVHEPDNGEEHQFIVTDLDGNILEDDALAQEVLDEFLAFAEEE